MTERAEILRVAELVCARLCHDLSGLIGTLHQTLELAPDDGEALALGRTAAAELMARLRLLRAAWSAAETSLPLAELAPLAAGLTGARNLTLDLTGVAEATVFPPAVGRMVLNLLLLANDSLPAGGRIALSGDATEVFVIIDGPHAAWPIGLALCLVDEGAARAACSDATTIQMPLTALLARGMGLRLSLLMATAGNRPAPLRLTAR